MFIIDKMLLRTSFQGRDTSFEGFECHETKIQKNVPSENLN